MTKSMDSLLIVDFDDSLFTDELLSATGPSEGLAMRRCLDFTAARFVAAASEASNVLLLTAGAVSLSTTGRDGFPLLATALNKPGVFVCSARDITDSDSDAAPERVPRSTDKSLAASHSEVKWKSIRFVGRLAEYQRIGVVAGEATDAIVQSVEFHRRATLACPSGRKCGALRKNNLLDNRDFLPWLPLGCSVVQKLAFLHNEWMQKSYFLDITFRIHIFNCQRSAWSRIAFFHFQRQQQQCQALAFESPQPKCGGGTFSESEPKVSSESSHWLA